MLPPTRFLRPVLRILRSQRSGLYSAWHVSSKNSDIGGGGNDTLHLYTDMSKNSTPRLTINQQTGTASFATSPATTFPLSGFTTLDIHGVGVTYVGTTGVDRVRTDGMQGLHATGNGGPDVFCGGSTYDFYKDNGQGSTVYPSGLYGRDKLTNSYIGISTVESPFAVCPISVG